MGSIFQSLLVFDDSPASAGGSSSGLQQGSLRRYSLRRVTKLLIWPASAGVCLNIPVVFFSALSLARLPLGSGFRQWDLIEAVRRPPGMSLTVRVMDRFHPVCRLCSHPHVPFMIFHIASLLVMPQLLLPKTDAKQPRNKKLRSSPSVPHI